MTPRRIAIVMMLAWMVVAAHGATASAAGPAWRIDSLSNTTVAAGATLEYELQVMNLGDEPTNAPATLTVALAPGLTVAPGGFSGAGGCSPSDPPDGLSTFSCTLGEGIGRHLTRQLTIVASVDPSASGVLKSSFQLAGGGAGTASTIRAARVSATAPGFGIEAFDGQVNGDPAGNAFTQAGGHPFSASTSFDFNTVSNPAHGGGLSGALWTVEPTKDVFADLPPGFVGYPPAAAKCSASELAISVDGLSPKPQCPTASQIGTALLRLNGMSLENVWGPIPVFNMTPPPDAPARFGFTVAGTVVTLDATVRGSDYGVTVHGNDISEGLAVAGATITFWGVPADSSHDEERACSGQLAPFDFSSPGPSCASGAPRVAFLRNPTSCAAPSGASPSDGLITGLHVDSWVDPGRLQPDGTPDLTDPAWKASTFVSHLPPGYPATPAEWGPAQLPTGCEKEPFAPTLTASAPAPVRAGSPAGLVVDLNSPQSSEPSAIGEADVRKAVVTLPAGMRISPSAAGGLGACSPDQIGLGQTSAPSCPDDSKVGTVEITTPLLEQPLDGSVYLATPHQNPFGSLIAIYLVAQGPGVFIKLPGRVDLDPVTGQITTTFDNQPQLPFDSVHLVFNDGPRAPLATPASCGTYTTDAELTAWSGKSVISDSSLTVSQAADGGPCRAPGFSPSLTAGTVNPVAGGFSPFTLQLTRADTDSNLHSLSSLTLPPGLLADVGSVPVRCTEAQATAGACPPASHVGSVTVGAGPGSNPFYVSGDIYLMGGFSSGPFAGDPFGLAFVVRAVAGPFDLGTVVVKAGIQIHDDGSVTTLAEPFPSILQGIPLDLRDVRVNLDRPNFMLNPTSCAPMAINGNVVSLTGQNAAISQRFQAADCASLAFRPHFTAATQANGTFNRNGASLDVKISSNQGPRAPAREANIHKVEVALPKVLPSRLTTLQRACTERQFALNPAGCPKESNIGIATAISPILKSPLAGPAYLVSHGGAAFPDLVLVLQGEGIILNVTGHTQIKAGITYSRFETVPDAPISSFELKLPEGPFSALAANGNLCAPTKTLTVSKRVTRRVHGHLRHLSVKVKRHVTVPLSMPTTITAQNGAVLNQSTKIAVTGCAKTKITHHAKTTKTHHRKRR